MAAPAALATLGSCGAVLSLGVLNRVLQKVVLVPMSNYVIFLTQMQTLTYLPVYFIALLLRYRAGKVPGRMFAAARREGPSIAAIGSCEAACQLLLMISSKMLPGVMLPVLQQSLMVWQLVFSMLILKRRFSPIQLAGAAVVIAGVVVCAAPFSSTAAAPPLHTSAPGCLPYVALFVISMGFLGVASVLKERVFRRASVHLNGGSLDLFIVNSFGSLAQACSELLLLPALLTASGIGLQHAGSYLGSGAACIRGLQPACGTDCSAAPLLIVLYLAANVGYNVAVLNTVRLLGSASVGLLSSCLVPLTICAFTLPVPLLGPSGPLTAKFFAGAVILVTGLLTYHSASLMELLKR